MRRIDALHPDYPFAGSRMLRDPLRAGGVIIGRDRVAPMMRRMGIEALYRHPKTSKPASNSAKLRGRSQPPGCTRPISIAHIRHLKSH